MEQNRVSSRIRRSWLLAAVSTVAVSVFYVAAVPRPEGASPLAAHFAVLAIASLVFGYLVWGTYWALFMIWRWHTPARTWLRGLPRAAKESWNPPAGAVVVVTLPVMILYMSRTLIAWVAVVACWYVLLWLTLIAAIPLGLLGGGFLEFREHRRQVRP